MTTWIVIIGAAVLSGGMWFANWVVKNKEEWL